MLRSRVAWLGLLAVLLAALAIGSVPKSGAPNVSQRVDTIAAGVRCPSCSGLSAAESNASTAVAVRDEIRRRVIAGETTSQIDSYLVSRYGQGILLRPPARGVAGLVWLIPVVAAAALLAILAGLFWKRRSALAAPLTEEDRTIVEAALAARSHGGG